MRENISRFEAILILAVFGLFLLTNGAYLNRVPGLMGDEASEGENVYEKLSVLTDDETQVARDVLVTGERSYIGPLIDYIRIPFIWVFGYSALALRVVILVFSIATFWLAWSVLRYQFGMWPGLFGLVLYSFSPAYVLYGRLGWAITLFPFFAFFILWCMQRQWNTRWLWAGLAAGLGLANHIIFLATLAGLAVGLVVYWILTVLPKLHDFSWKYVRGLAIGILQTIVGFWAGFGMQFVVLYLFKEDQGAPSETTQLFGERVSLWLHSFPLYISGSSFIARYVGVEMSPVVTNGISWLLIGLALVGVVLLWRKKAIWAWIVGGSVYMAAILYVIDRFTLRYFYMASLLVWLLAGLGVGALLQLGLRKHTRWLAGGLIGVTFVLMIWMGVAVLFPFLRTGGSVANFSLGDRTNSADALVDARGLINCVRGAGPVYSENIHIWNRLEYVSHQYSDIELLSDEEAALRQAQGSAGAEWIIHYREPTAPGGTTPGELCPELDHFRIVRP